MEELLKKLIESELLSQETVDSIKEAIADKEAEIEDRVRREFSESYKRDRDLLVVAVEAMLEDRLRPELEEFREDRANLRKMTAKATRAVHEAEEKAKKSLSKKMEVIESLMLGQLKTEIEEFAEDRKIQRKTFLKQVNENKARSERDRAAFIRKGAAVLESLMEGELRKLITEFRDDIAEAKKNDFGRRVFEAMAAEYRTTFFNSNSEAKKLAKELAESKKALTKLKSGYKKRLSETSSKLQESEKRRARLEESSKRQAKISSLVSKLSDPKAKRDMKAILENSRTDKLEDTFTKYLSEVTKPRSRTGRTPLSESRGPSGSAVLKTGNSAKQISESSDVDEDIQRTVEQLKRKIA